MRILILGATGLVGHSLWRDWKGRGWEVFGTYLRRAVPGLFQLDLLDGAAVSEQLKRLKPNVLVLAASNPHVDYCEAHAEETRRLNVEAALRIVRMLRGAGVKPVFFSSDYVFDGAADRPYREDDPARPLNEYGRQKAEVEDGIRKALRDFLILRVSGVFGWELQPKNFALQVLDRCRASPMRVATDIRYNPTYARDLAPAVAELLEARAAGIYHVAGAQELRRFDFARRIAEVFGLDPGNIRPALSAELSPTRRPGYSSLDMAKLREAVRAVPREAGQALLHMRDAAPEWEGYVRSLGLS